MLITFLDKLCAIRRWTCMNRNIFLSTIIIHFFFSFHFKRARMRRKIIKKSCVIWIAKRIAEQHMKNTPQTFFSFFLSISIKRIVNCSWERKEMKIIVGGKEKNKEWWVVKGEIRAVDRSRIVTRYFLWCKRYSRLNNSSCSNIAENSVAFRELWQQIST
jgi:hypothetical protein